MLARLRDAHSHLSGGETSENRSIFSDCLSAVRGSNASFDCKIHSQNGTVPALVPGLGLVVVVLVCAGRDVW